MRTDKQRIPIFFASDENYLPYVAVTIRSIAEHASDDYVYDIKILTDGFSEKGVGALACMAAKNIEISIVDINAVIKESRKLLQLRLRDYYSEAIFYRLYIAELFPELSRAIYIDCDIVLVDDIAKLYFSDIGDNVLGAISDESIPKVKPFSDYVRHWIGIAPEEYINSGVLVMNLDSFRKYGILEKFSDLVTRYNFETVAPDQDYLNYLCHGKIKYLDEGWNKQPDPDRLIPRAELHLVHYNFYKKPWHYDSVFYKELFWRIADRTEFAEEIHRSFDEYTDAERAADEAGGLRLMSAAAELSVSGGGFAETLGDSYQIK